MDIQIHPKRLAGTIEAIPSKSQAHRLLICAAFADGPTTLLCPQTSQDIDATADCLRALGADISRDSAGYHILPITRIPVSAALPCRESGTTVRFLLPVVGALGVEATFYLEGRLSARPLSPLWEEMTRMGCHLSRPTEHTVRCRGRLLPGKYTIAGNVSSQFISGLLFALPLLKEDSELQIQGPLESKPYIDMTIQTLNLFQVQIKSEQIPGNQIYRTPGTAFVEGDWSNSAFFLAANALGSAVTVKGLSPSSSQGDREIVRLLPQLKDFCRISAAQIPDLVPILSVVAATNKGALFTDIRRLRLKESDRITAILSMIHALGGQGEATENTLRINGTGLQGGIVDSAKDHRIAMAAAIAATSCQKDVTILSAECVSKSYPQFWTVYRQLGGNYEQYIR